MNSRHQLGRIRLVRIVAGQAIGLFERLVLVRLLQVGVLHIVAIDAQRGSVLGQMVIKLALAPLARLVRDVASVAAHVEGGVAASLLWNIRSLRVAAQAEIVFLIAGGWLQQLVLVVGSMRIVALHAIANGRWMNRPLISRGVFVGVAGEAQLVGSGGDQLYARDVFVDPDLVATGTAHRNRGVDRLALCLVLVAGDAGGGIRLRVKRHRMFRSGNTAGKHHHHHETDQRV